MSWSPGGYRVHPSELRAGDVILLPFDTHGTVVGWELGPDRIAGLLHLSMGHGPAQLLMHRYDFLELVSCWLPSRPSPPQGP